MFGLETALGTTGEEVSRVKLLLLVLLVFPALSRAVTIAVSVQVDRVRVVRLQSPLLFVVVVNVCPSTTTVITLPDSAVPIKVGVLSLV